MKNLKLNHEINTDLGTIIVRESGDSNYPGLYVDFKPKNSNIERSIALVECINKSEYNENAELRVLVWGQQGMMEDGADYTHKFSIFNEEDMKNVINI